MLYVFGALVGLLDWDCLFSPKRLLRSTNITAVIGVLAVICAVKLSQGLLTNRPGYMALNTYLLTIGIGTVAKPGVFFVAHVNYFGPLLVLAAFVWKDVCRGIHQQGVGLTLAVCIGVLHGLDSESRHMIYVVPMLFPFIVKAIEPLRWTNRQYVFVAVSSLLLSKVWLTISGAFHDNVFMYPDQLYAMNLGPFLGDEMYLAQAAAVLLIAGLTYVMCIAPFRQTLIDFWQRTSPAGRGLTNQVFISPPLESVTSCPLPLPDLDSRAGLSQCRQPA